MKRVLSLNFFLALLAAVSLQAHAINLSFCYIPGAGGGDANSFEIFPRELAQRGVPFKGFDVRNKGSIQFHAQVFRDLLQAELARDPDFRCHVLGFSQGGLVARYAIAHLIVQHPLLGARPLSDFVIALTTLSSPHFGTPLPRLIERTGIPIDEGESQLRDDRIHIFNEPAYPDTYSPEIPGIVYSSFRTWLGSASEATNTAKKFSFRMIFNDLQGRGLDPRNDSVVPFETQGFGKVLGDLRLPHGYFSKDYGIRPGPVDFYVHYWEYLAGLRAEPHPRFDPVSVEWAEDLTETMSLHDLRKEL